MSFEKALAKRMLTAEPIAEKVASRVDWMRRPQAAALPAITLQIITDNRDQHYGGFHPSVIHPNSSLRNGRNGVTTVRIEEATGFATRVVGISSDVNVQSQRTTSRRVAMQNRQRLA